MAEVEDDGAWIKDLEKALLEGCDFGILRTICQGKPVPAHLRPQVWKICLNITDTDDTLSGFDGLYDMDEQKQVREDCQKLVENLGNEEEDKVSIVSDLEEIITFYCKSKNIKYSSDNGWLEILQPMLSLKLPKEDLYNVFYAFLNRYVPRECKKNGKPFHLFRLLLQYHEPELCSFLDTKRVTPDLYAHSWFRSVLAGPSDLDVILNMWDVYLQQADPFLMFFLSLVILVNAKEQLVEMEQESKHSIIEKIVGFPSALEAEDIEDFCSLAQYYASKTPQSFRRDYQVPLYGSSGMSSHRDDQTDIQVSQALCLPVSVGELLQANQLGGGDGVRYFVVDCRPAEQYNSGHLPTAFHLDANLMLQNPFEFNTAVQALFATQKQAISAGSVAGGEHLCFVGSGREEEDQYVHMVVANFLQKHTAYVSVARGGYTAIHESLKGNLAEGIKDHNPKSCIVCNPDAPEAAADIDSTEEFGEKKISFREKFSALKSKSAEMREKLVSYIKNEHQGAEERHVSSADKVGKRYRNMANVFTIDDDDDDELPNTADSDDDRKETVHIDTWRGRSDVLHAFKCNQVIDSGHMFESHLLITESHMYVLRDIPNKKGMALIMHRRPLATILKITSKKKLPELISFKYGTNGEEMKITDVDRFLIQEAGEATKVIKRQIMKVLDMLDT
ncbi:TBC1 domain family member 23 [Lingula anatina]|uniref:TBC1 domain family member 23 n=1 Tax=Lingula anatina TaxID=7574 RepID=A0A1S3JZI7_LINAN|nr:TBC1 domain family member 23 [Lingula anatina]|eukprot:XP_013415519.1 TBC1 domain family member 23 [Lingula anatina]